MEIIKGRNVLLWIDDQVISGSTDCEFTIKANTADVASKTDAGDGMWDKPELVNYDFTCSNQSFLCDQTSLKALLNKVVNGNATVNVMMCPSGGYIIGNWNAIKGSAIISQVQIDAPNGDKAKVSLSFEGNGALYKDSSGKTYTPETSLPAINGKALMVAIQRGDKWFTFMCATSHTLTINVQTSDASHKDVGVHKEVTGKSVSLSTQNLFAMETSPDTENGITFMLDSVMAGDLVKLKFGYYAEALPDAENTNWGDPSTTYIQGDFLISQIQIQAPTKEKATYSAEFSNVGQVMLY